VREIRKLGFTSRGLETGRDFRDHECARLAAVQVGCSKSGRQSGQQATLHAFTSTRTALPFSANQQADRPSAVSDGRLGAGLTMPPTRILPSGVCTPRFAGNHDLAIKAERRL
jgi:hypothetical protein